MAWPLLVAAGVQVASSAANWFMGNQAEAAKRRNALEGVRRNDRERDYTLGAARAAGAASGVEFESESLQKYLADMSAEFQRQSRAERRAAEGGAELGRAANALGLGAGLGSAFFQLGAASNWWQAPKPSIR